MFTYTAQQGDIEKIYLDCINITNAVTEFSSEVQTGLTDSVGNRLILEYSRKLIVLEGGVAHKHAEIKEVGNGYAPDTNTISDNYAGLLEVYNASLDFVLLIQELCPEHVEDIHTPGDSISTDAFIMFLLQKCADFQVFTDYKEHYDTNRNVVTYRPRQKSFDFSAAFMMGEAATAGEAGSAAALLPQAEDLAPTKPKRQKVQMRKPVTDVSTD